MYQIEINENQGIIRISKNEREMLEWDHTEWEEDPELVFTIANAIHMALTKPEEMDETLKKMGKLK